MLGKTLLQLDEVARSVAPDLDPNDVIQDYSAKLMTQHAVDQLRPSELFQSALVGSELVRNAPGHLDRILSLAAGEGLVVRGDVLGLSELLTSVRKVANRITVGLVIASMIVGAALIMDVPTGWTLFGYPVFAITMFVIAGMTGMALVATTLWSDWWASRRRHPPKS